MFGAGPQDLFDDAVEESIFANTIAPQSQPVRVGASLTEPARLEQRVQELVDDGAACWLTGEKIAHASDASRMYGLSKLMLKPSANAVRSLLTLSKTDARLHSWVQDTMKNDPEKFKLMALALKTDNPRTRTDEQRRRTITYVQELCREHVVKRSVVHALLSKREYLAHMMYKQLYSKSEAEQLWKDAEADTLGTYREIIDGKTHIAVCKGINITEEDIVAKKRRLQEREENVPAHEVASASAQDALIGSCRLSKTQTQKFAQRSSGARHSNPFLGAGASPLGAQTPQGSIFAPLADKEGLESLLYQAPRVSPSAKHDHSDNETSSVAASRARSRSRTRSPAPSKTPRRAASTAALSASGDEEVEDKCLDVEDLLPLPDNHAKMTMPKFLALKGNGKLRSSSSKATSATIKNALRKRCNRSCEMYQTFSMTPLSTRYSPRKS